jgi:hypothetical protein
MAPKPPQPDPLNVVASCIPGVSYHVPNLKTLDARLRDLHARIQLNAHTPALVYRFELDRQSLLLHREWLTLLVDPNAREHCDQTPA